MEAMTQKALFISFLVSLARLHKSYDIWQEVIDFILSLSVAPELFGQPGFKFITWLKRSYGWAMRRVCQPILRRHKFSYTISLVNELPLHAFIDFVYQTLKKMLKRKTMKASSMHLVHLDNETTRLYLDKASQKPRLCNDVWIKAQVKILHVKSVENASKRPTWKTKEQSFPKYGTLLRKQWVWNEKKSDTLVILLFFTLRCLCTSYQSFDNMLIFLF